MRENLLHKLILVTVIWIWGTTGASLAYSKVSQVITPCSCISIMWYLNCPGNIQQACDMGTIVHFPATRSECTLEDRQVHVICRNSIWDGTVADYRCILPLMSVSDFQTFVHNIKLDSLTYYLTQNCVIEVILLSSCLFMNDPCTLMKQNSKSRIIKRL